jgi:hypothetical protein
MSTLSNPINQVADHLYKVTKKYNLLSDPSASPLPQANNTTLESDKVTLSQSTTPSSNVNANFIFPKERKFFDILVDLAITGIFSPIAALTGALVGAATKTRMGGAWGAIIGGASVGTYFTAKYLNFTLIEKKKGFPIKTGLVETGAAAVTPALGVTAGGIAMAAGAAPTTIAIASIVGFALPALLFGGSLLFQRLTRTPYVPDPLPTPTP